MLYQFKNVRSLGLKTKVALVISLALVIRASFFVRRRDADAFNQVDSSNIIAIVLVGASLIFILSKKGMKVISYIFKGPFKFFILYMFYCCVTSLWSLDPIYTLYRSFELLIVLFLIGYIIYSINDIFNLKRVALFFILISMIGGIGQVLKRGNLSIEAFHTNTYTIVAAIGIIFSYYQYHYFKKLKIIRLYNLARITLLISILGLLVGTSSASNVSFLVGILVLIFLKRGMDKTKFFVILLIIIIINFWYVFSDYLMALLFPNKEMSDIISGTGRTYMWQYYIDGFLQNPIFGYGFPSGEKMGSLFGWEVTSSTHNMLLSVAVNTGTIGLILYLIFIKNYTVFLIRKLKISSEVKYSFAIWVIIVINSMSFPILGSHWSWTTSTAFFIMVYSQRVYYISSKNKA